MGHDDEANTNIILLAARAWPATSWAIYAFNRPLGSAPRCVARTSAPIRLSRRICSTGSISLRSTRVEPGGESILRRRFSLRRFSLSLRGLPRCGCMNRVDHPLRLRDRSASARPFFAGWSANGSSEGNTRFDSSSARPNRERTLPLRGGHPRTPPATRRSARLDPIDLRVPQAAVRERRSVQCRLPGPDRNQRHDRRPCGRRRTGGAGLLARRLRHPDHAPERRQRVRHQRDARERPVRRGERHLPAADGNGRAAAGSWQSRAGGIDRHEEIAYSNAAINAVNAAAACYGFDCPRIVMLDPPVKLVRRYTSTGRAAGRVDNLGDFLDGIRPYLENADADGGLLGDRRSARLPPRLFRQRRCHGQPLGRRRGHLHARAVAALAALGPFSR